MSQSKSLVPKCFKEANASPLAVSNFPRVLHGLGGY